MDIAYRKLISRAVAIMVGPILVAASGCATCGTCCQTDPCCEAPTCCAPETCCDAAPCCDTGCCDKGCNSCCSLFYSCLFGRRSNAIPDVLPLGSTVRAHYEQMQTNGEAVDFVINEVDFVRESAALTPNGRDHILEIAARMPSSPFPVVIERTRNNADPELDAIRQQLVVQVLSDLGSPDANSRVFIATPYGPGYTGREAEQTYFQHIRQGGNNNFNNGGNNGGGGGFGGGGFGGF